MHVFIAVVTQGCTAGCDSGPLLIQGGQLPKRRSVCGATHHVNHHIAAWGVGASRLQAFPLRADPLLLPPVGVQARHPLRRSGPVGWISLRLISTTPLSILRSSNPSFRVLPTAAEQRQESVCAAGGSHPRLQRSPEQCEAGITPGGAQVQK